MGTGIGIGTGSRAKKKSPSASETRGPARTTVARPAKQRGGQNTSQRKHREYVREHKAVAIDPFGILWVERHELVEQDVGHGGHAHGGTRVTRVGLECGIDLENTNPSAIDTSLTPTAHAGAVLGKKLRWRGSCLAMAGQPGRQ